MTAFLHHLLGHLLPGAASTHLMFVSVAAPLPAVSPVGPRSTGPLSSPWRPWKAGPAGTATELARSPESHC